MSEPHEVAKRICRACHRDDLDVNDKGPCPHCGDPGPHTLTVELMENMKITESGETIEERWIENKYYQVLLIALIVIPLIISLLMQSWIPIIVGLVADVIAYFIGDRARHKERTIRPF